jgi:hypothetical protein
LAEETDKNLLNVTMISTGQTRQLYTMRGRWNVWMPLALAGLVDRAIAANTFPITWSPESYGPDGPWQAVQVRIGSENKLINLYPGGTWASNILTPSICNNASLGDVCYAKTAGLYDFSLSLTSEFSKVDIFPRVDYTGGALQIFGTPPQTGTDNWNISDSTIDMFPIGINMALQTSSWATLPDGSTYPLSVGSLALGAPGTVNQTFTLGDGVPAFNATLLPGFLSTEAPSNTILSSNSYGLHIGSVSPQIPGSLYFGGFDQNRALGTISTQEGSPDDVGAIDLLDITLSVNSGASPWSFNSLGGQLASGNSSIVGQLPVAINSLAPYLHLPKSTCDALAANLPVTYQEKYGLYFWNSSDPQYERIVSSPSYIGFTFRVSESSTNFTINVPFSLLNLTLTAPLTTTPTAYFPCKAETQTHYQLGRAFLQAAFVGVNWNAYNGSAAWWLAQAPGPNTPSQLNIQAIGNTDTTIPSSQVDWASTWQDTWKPLVQAAQATQTSGVAGSSSAGTGAPAASSGTISSPTNSKTKSGLSTAAKAGVGVGVGIVVFAATAGIIMYLLRSREPTEVAAVAEAAAAGGAHQTAEMLGSYGTGYTAYAFAQKHTTYYDPVKPLGQGLAEIYSADQRYELHAT